MQHGKVSILLPSLNAFEFLEKRIASIQEQSYDNWEAIVLDSFSTDGTWEYFQKLAQQDQRFKLHQIPRDGLYSALNRGIDLASGEFIHIATCDDTMDRDFLMESVNSLNTLPGVGIAATDVQFIDKDGQDLPVEQFGNGRVRTSIHNHYFSSITLRKFPHDFLLHFTACTVYFSLTQLLIRRNIITESCYFDAAIGSMADFNWALKLCSKSDTVHIPKKLATWRFHGNQLSLQQDENRLGHVLEACRSAMADNTSLALQQKSALLLPLDMIDARVNGSRSEVVKIYLKAIKFGLGAFIKTPLSALNSLKLSGIGRDNFASTWLRFIINLSTQDPTQVLR